MLFFKQKQAYFLMKFGLLGHQLPTQGPWHYGDHDGSNVGVQAILNISENLI